MSAALLCSTVTMAAPFTDNKNGTVTDNRTGLIWQQGEPGWMIWPSALDYCNGLTLGGHSDWRLPNIKELESLTDDERYHPAIDTNFFPNAYASYYWSSTTYASDPGYAWIVVFSYGCVYGYYKYDSYYYVRCVRGGQSGLFGNLEVSPSSHDFGEVEVGTCSLNPQVFALGNFGDGEINVSMI
ncbi:MAG: DUF1566 domain-containing protein [Nitrospirae bacterium]|nr:DUF1566 domain-containing protein [Nitrospirota bacterium]